MEFELMVEEGRESPVKKVKLRRHTHKDYKLVLVEDGQFLAVFDFKNKSISLSKSWKFEG